MRSQGFRCPENIEGFIRDFHSQKNLDLKLHACLVECDDLGTRFRMENDTKVKIPGTPDFNDRLDEVSDIFVQNGGYEFKQFDYSVKGQL